MKINPINNPGFIKSYKTSQTAYTQKSTVPPRLDEVTFSKEGLSFAKTLAEVKSAMNEAPAVRRQQKLDEISEKIRRGEYNIDSADVAEKMISDILGKSKG